MSHQTILIAVVGISGGEITSTVDALFYNKNKKCNKGAITDKFREFTAFIGKDKSCKLAVLETPELEPYSSETHIASTLSEIENNLLHFCKKYETTKPHFILFTASINEKEEVLCQKLSKMIRAFNIISDTLFSTTAPNLLFIFKGGSSTCEENFGKCHSIIKSYMINSEIPYGTVLMDKSTLPETIWNHINSAMKLNSSILEDSSRLIQRALKSGNCIIQDNAPISNIISESRADSILHKLCSGPSTNGRSIIRAQIREAWDELRLTKIDLNRVLYVFDSMKISGISDIPRNKLKIAALISRLPLQETLPFLLKTSAGIEIPTQDTKGWQLACGYDAFGCKFLSKSVFQIENSQSNISPWGCLIPQEFKCKSIFDVADIFKNVPNYEAYVDMRNHDVGISTTGAIEVDLDIEGNHLMKVNKGYNILPYGNEQGHCFSFLKELRLYQIELDYKTCKFDSKIIQKINSLPEYKNDSDVLEEYRKFFKEYGTHIITKCFAGGQLEMNGKIEGSYSLTKFTNLKMESWLFFPYWWSTYYWRLAFLEDNLKKLMRNGKASEERCTTASVAEMTFFSGVKVRNLILNDKNNNSIQFTQENWVKEAYISPVILSTNCETISISNYISEREDIREEVKVNIGKAYETLFLKHGVNYTCGIASYK